MNNKEPLMNNITIGIDPSINSTGICVVRDKECKYYIITSKITKKLQQFESPHVKILFYKKNEIKDLEYKDKEIAKTNNIYNICKIISNIIDCYRPSMVFMEGISYGSTQGSALVDLAGLNYAIRMILKCYNIPFEIIPPTSVKKFAVSIGNADKDIIIDAWKRLDPNIKDIKDIKIDDLADSYFIAHYKP